MTRIHHASVNTKGTLDAAHSFYTETLGLREASRPDIGVGGHWFEAGDGSQVHLIDADPLGSGIDPVGHHYCLAVEDLGAAVAELEAAGIECMKIGDGADGQVFVNDPAGNTIELQQDR